MMSMDQEPVALLGVIRSRSSVLLLCFSSTSAVNVLPYSFNATLISRCLIERCIVWVTVLQEGVWFGAERETDLLQRNAPQRERQQA